MKLYFLGTGSQKPSKTRNVTSIALILQTNKYILFDCGEGTQQQILKSNISLTNLHSIFITHLHGDHIFGLPGLLFSMNEILEEKIFTIYGPLGLSKFVNNTVLNGVYGSLSYKLIIHEFKSNLKTKLDPIILITGRNAGEKYEIQSFPVKHTSNDQGQTYGYIIKKSDQLWFKDPKQSGLIELLQKNKKQVLEWANKNSNKNNKDVCSVLNILQKINKDLILDDKILGIINIRKDPRYVNKVKKGLCICLIIDNCESIRALEALGEKSCDVLVHESTNSKTSLDKDKTYEEIERDTISHRHSTPLMAGKLAKLLNVKQLILTHFSSRYKGDLSDESVAIMDEIKQSAIDSFANNNVITARDLMEIDLMEIDLY